MKVFLILAVLLILAFAGLTIVMMFLRGTTWDSDLRSKKLDQRVTMDLAGLATVQVPPTFRLLGLTDTGPGASYRDRVRPERHRDTNAAMFQLAQGNLNSIGGHEREPVLLNVTLFNPVAANEKLATGFRVHRYYSPTGSTIPTDSPRWQTESSNGLTWRWLDMVDHFDSGEMRRWAIMVADPARHVRLDFFAWQKEYTLETGKKLLGEILGSIRTTPTLAEHFALAGNYEARMEQVLDRRLRSVDDALAPLGLGPQKPGVTQYVTRGAAWLDTDRKAIWWARCLGKVRLPDGVVREGFGRPVLPLVLKAGQYSSGSTIGGLPSVDIQMLYWDESAGRWRLSDLQRRTADEHQDLHPFIQGVADRLPDRASAYLFRFAHFYQPPALDDASSLPDLMADADRFAAELAAGRILRDAVSPPDLKRSGE